MPRRKRQSDIEDITGKPNGHGKPGHNGARTLTDDERRAMTLHHRGLYAAATERVEAAKAERKKIADLAKADLGAGVIGDIKDMIAASDPEIMKAGVERALRLARWMGLPVGTQVSMFDVPVDERSRNAGVAAGMEGKVCEPPKHLAVTEHQAWISGWHEGQEVLASAFKKLDRTDTPVEANDNEGASQPAA